MSILQLMATRGAGGASLTTPTIWYDASDTSTITNVSGKASAIADKGSSGDDLIQSTDANRPLTGSTTQNGLNTLDYSAGSKSLYNLTPNTTAVTVQLLVGYLASSVTYTSGSKCLMSFSAANIGHESVFIGSITGSFGDEIISSFSNSGISKTSYGSTSASISSGVQIIAIRMTNTVREIRLNGGIDLSNRFFQSTNQHQVSEIFLNSASTSGSFLGWSEFCEFRGFSADITDEQLNAHGAALAAKWGITWTNIS